MKKPPACLRYRGVMRAVAGTGNGNPSTGNFPRT
jgi:hypothetical protein